jgi:hypothetical protein
VALAMTVLERRMKAAAARKRLVMAKIRQGVETVRTGAAAPQRGRRADRFMRRLFDGVVTVLRQFREIVNAKMRRAEPVSIRPFGALDGIP